MRAYIRDPRYVRDRGITNNILFLSTQKSCSMLHLPEDIRGEVLYRLNYMPVRLALGHGGIS